GGIAGLAAATLLAERGARVTLYEAQDSLGGRLSGHPTRLADGSPATMSRGFHAFFRQYYNLRGLLRRTDPGLTRLVPLPDYPLPPPPQQRPDRQLRPRPPDTPLQRARLRRAQPHLRLARPRRPGRPVRPAPPRPPRTGRLHPLRPRQRHPLPRIRPLPRGRPPPRVRGVLPQLLRRPARTVRRGTAADVPHLLPRLRRGPALRRARRALPAGPVEPARRLPRPPGRRRAHRGPRAHRPAPGRRGSGPAHGHRRRPPRRGGARPRPRRPARPRRRLSRPGRRRLARRRRRPAHRAAVPGLPALAGPPGPRRPRRVPRYQWLRRARQHQRPGTLRG